MAPRYRLQRAIAAHQRDVTFTVALSVDGRAPLTTDLGTDWSCGAGGPCHYQLTSLSIRDMPAEWMPAAFAQANNARGDVTFEPDGLVVIQPATFMSTTPSITELLKIAIIPLPREPIGAGAVWHVTEPHAKRTYTASAVTASALSVEVATTDGENGQTATSSGAIEAELGDPLARTLSITQAQRFEAGSRSIDMSSKVTLGQRAAK